MLLPIESNSFATNALQFLKQWFAEKKVKAVGVDHQAFDHPLATAIGPHGPNGIPATPLTLEIPWEDSNQAKAEYDHVLLASVVGEAKGDLMHEYQAIPSGTRMHSHFHIAGDAPEELINALYEHNKQEMHNFITFLPDLYRSQAGG